MEENNSSYLYVDQSDVCQTLPIIPFLSEYANENCFPIYVLSAPLTERKYKSSYSFGCVLLIPNHKITFINCSENDDDFEDYVSDTLEDIGSISDRFQFKEKIGRPRSWSDLYTKINICEIQRNLGEYLHDIKVNKTKTRDIRTIEIIISLFIGSINNVNDIIVEQPDNILDSIKFKIQLFDCDQTRFIYYEPDASKKIIRIQGLSGTGKTELLLHKLKDIYISDKDARIGFTCYSKVLADTLRKRIPVFFDYMNVPQQIAWDERLLCVNSWGQFSNHLSGIYRYICNFYNIQFFSYGEVRDFSSACRQAIETIKQIKESNPQEFIYAFQYIFIDECQDFQEDFFELCECVTEKRIYAAGDVFQSIYANSDDSKDIKGDFLLNKCYRTDPKTFMIAQALGWGLFESSKIRWLSDDAWRVCGYSLTEINDTEIKLHRKPLKRFDGENEDEECFKLVESDNVVSDIMDIISSLKEKFSNIKADDICIIFLDSQQYIYNIVPQIKEMIFKTYEWDTDVAYETKKKEINKLFITNHRNVKGLEFPFVICYTKRIMNNIPYRNLLYTMISRSFLRTYLVIDSAGSDSINSDMRQGIKQIMEEGCMELKKPSVEEKENMERLRLEYQQTRSLKDRLDPIISKYRIPGNSISKLLEFIKTSSKPLDEDSDLENFVVSLKKLGLL